MAERNGEEIGRGRTWQVTVNKCRTTRGPGVSKRHPDSKRACGQEMRYSEEPRLSDPRPVNACIGETLPTHARTTARNTRTVCPPPSTIDLVVQQTPYRSHKIPTDKIPTASTISRHFQRLPTIP